MACNNILKPLIYKILNEYSLLLIPKYFIFIQEKKGSDTPFILATQLCSFKLEMLRRIGSIFGRYNNRQTFQMNILEQKWILYIQFGETLRNII